MVKGLYYCILYSISFCITWNIRDQKTLPKDRKTVTRGSVDPEMTHHQGCQVPNPWDLTRCHSEPSVWRLLYGKQVFIVNVNHPSSAYSGSECASITLYFFSPKWDIHGICTNLRSHIHRPIGPKMRTVKFSTLGTWTHLWKILKAVGFLRAQVADLPKKNMANAMESTFFLKEVIGTLWDGMCVHFDWCLL